MPEEVGGHVFSVSAIVTGLPEVEAMTVALGNLERAIALLRGGAVNINATGLGMAAGGASAGTGVRARTALQDAKVATEESKRAGGVALMQQRINTESQRTFTEQQRTRSAGIRADNALLMQQRAHVGNIRQEWMNVRRVALDMTYTLQTMAMWTGIGAGALAAGGLMAGKAAIGASARAENYRAQVATLVGPQSGERAYKAVRAFALKSPLTFEETIDSAKLLLGYQEKFGDIIAENTGLLATFTKASIFANVPLGQVVKSLEAFKTGKNIRWTRLTPLQITPQWVESLGIKLNKQGRPLGNPEQNFDIIMSAWTKKMASYNPDELLQTKLANVSDVMFAFWSTLGDRLSPAYKKFLTGFENSVMGIVATFESPDVAKSMEEAAAQLIGPIGEQLTGLLDNLSSIIRSDPSKVTEWFNAFAQGLKTLTAAALAFAGGSIMAGIVRTIATVGGAFAASAGNPLVGGALAAVAIIGTTVTAFGLIKHKLDEVLPSIHETKQSTDDLIKAAGVYPVTVIEGVEGVKRAYGEQGDAARGAAAETMVAVGEQLQANLDAADNARVGWKKVGEALHTEATHWTAVGDELRVSFKALASDWAGAWDVMAYPVYGLIRAIDLLRGAARQALESMGLLLPYNTTPHTGGDAKMFGGDQPGWAYNYVFGNPGKAGETPWETTPPGNYPPTADELAAAAKEAAAARKAELALMRESWEMPVAYKGGFTAGQSFGANRYRGGKWHHYHQGLDFPVPYGTDVTAAASGTIEEILRNTRYGGNIIIINHGDGLKTKYMHLAKMFGNVGETVEQGAKIGLSGDTGSPGYYHLHFEDWVNGKPVNPMGIWGTNVRGGLDPNLLARQQILGPGSPLMEAVKNVGDIFRKTVADWPAELSKYLQELADAVTKAREAFDSVASSVFNLYGAQQDLVGARFGLESARLNAMGLDRSAAINDAAGVMMQLQMQRVALEKFRSTYGSDLTAQIPLGEFGALARQQGLQGQERTMVLGLAQTLTGGYGMAAGLREKEGGAQLYGALMKELNAAKPLVDAELIGAQKSAGDQLFNAGTQLLFAASALSNAAGALGAFAAAPPPVGGKIAKGNPILGALTGEFASADATRYAGGNAGNFFGGEPIPLGSYGGKYDAFFGDTSCGPGG